MRATEFISELGMTKDYNKPLGMMEMFKFFQVATPEQKAFMKKLIDNAHYSKAWELLQNVTGVELGESSVDNTVLTKVIKYL